MNSLASAVPRCLLLMALLAPIAHANPVAQLQAAGQLQVDSALTPADSLVPRQKTSLILEIATDRWFAGGTRISIPEVPGLVILQTEQFASNASENREGQNWVVQRWTLDVYPQHAGDFTIPPIKLQVKVNTDTGNVEGEVYSPAIQFSVMLPASLAQAQQWVAAPSFNVGQRFDRSLEGLQVGDAFEREVVFEAADVMAMMLPAFTAEKLPGMAVYPLPPTLDNSNNRGQSSARRTQRISYVMQSGGEYLLPAREFFWWDTQAAQLRLLSLPATPVTVGAGAAAQTSSVAHITVQQMLVAASGLLLLVAMVWLVRKWLPRLPGASVLMLLSDAWQQLRELRKPALPRRLNPDSSAGD